MTALTTTACPSWCDDKHDHIPSHSRHRPLGPRGWVSIMQDAGQDTPIVALDNDSDMAERDDDHACVELTPAAAAALAVVLDAIYGPSPAAQALAEAAALIEGRPCQPYTPPRLIVFPAGESDFGVSDVSVVSVWCGDPDGRGGITP